MPADVGSRDALLESKVTRKDDLEAVVSKERIRLPL